MFCKPEVRIGYSGLFPAVVLISVILIYCYFVSLASAQVSTKPAEVVSASETQYPIHSIASGVVVLDIALDSKGMVTESHVVRDIPSLTSAAMSSVQSWKFNPTFDDGVPQVSTMRVAFVFRPPVYVAAGPKFVPIISNAGSNSVENSSEYIPAGIVSVSYPQYPINAVISGVVVIQVTVDKGGEIERLKTIRDLKPFTQFALSAARKWQFQAATLHGKPKLSNAAIAFVFAPPLVTQ